MVSTNSKDKDEQRLHERARAPIEAYPTKSGELSSAGQTLLRKVQRLNVDDILSRSFKDVRSIGLR